MGDDVTDGARTFPAEAVRGSVGDRFLEIASIHGERTALRSPHGALTYAELALAVGRLAQRLLDASDDHADAAAPVALLAEHDGPLVVGMLACVMAGRPFVVLDPPAPDVGAVLAASGATVLLHDDVHAASAVDRSAAVDRPPRLLTLEPGDGPPLERAVRRAADDPVMLAFTSGTTGGSKGAVIPHGLLLNVIRGATDALRVTPGDRLPMLFPASLAVAAYPAFLPLLNGGCLATLDVRSVGIAPLADFLADERITVAYLAPTVVRFMVDALGGRRFPDLRLVALGGEPVDGEIVRLTADLFGVPAVANGFGATETGVIALHVVGSPAAAPDGPVPSGYPVPDIELVIVGDDGTEVDRGVPGEVVVRSPYLFRGYLGHDELTAAVLAPDPLGRPGWRSYRTGDLGRVDDDGRLVVQGRRDATVKVRGRFVVLGDVERDIQATAGVIDAVVVPVVVDGIVDLAAMVAAPPDAGVTPVLLRRTMLAAHEAYRVPTRWRVVDDLPRLPNGKVDRRAAAAELESLPGVDVPAAVATPASDRIGRELRELWEALLPVELVGPDDDFMELGGHSLLAAQMLVMAEDALGITIPMSELIHARTLRQLTAVAVRIDAAAETSPSTVACVQAGDPDRPRLWFLHDLPGSAYRIRHVAEHLGPDQPVWSFESPLLRGEPNRFRALDTFVARYLRDLRAAQPDGPYWLAGYSFGGPCAYEMALQLREDGQEVALLAVVDTGPGYRGPNWTGRHSPPWPYFGVPPAPPRDATVRQAAAHYRDMVRRSPRAAARHLSIRTGAARRIDAVRFASDLRRHGRVRPEWRLWYAWEQHWRLAVKAWDRTKPYSGRLDLLWASETGSTDGTMGWSSLVDDLRIHRFAGFHDDLLEESGAPAVAGVLRPIIDELIRDLAADVPADVPADLPSDR